MELFILILVLIVLTQTSYVVFRLMTLHRPVRVSRPIFVDTSVLIDGRILMIAETGFIGGTLIVPRSVLGELQYLADNADHEKRTRARHGLDVVKQLQDMASIDVEIMQDSNRPEDGVDNQLIKLAKKHDGAILTIDYNLNKVAVVEKIEILNVNELAQKLRMSYLPGEKTTITIVQTGQDSHQGVGYLIDGTMVVVEQASKLIGKQVEVEFIRALQTAAGKMMFAKTVEQSKGNSHKSNPKSNSGRKPTRQLRNRFQRSAKNSPEDDLIDLVSKQN